MTHEELKAAAAAMLDRAYVPYSHFPVGAALECSDGNRPPIVVSGISVPRVHRYVCCTCGYSEEWVDPRDLPALKKEFGPPI